ncbi:MAG: LysE family transporter [Thermodesulfobacteriota bacterium]
MEISRFVQGLVMGFSIAAPVGPIGVLCMRRALAHGAVSGLASGMGAATADAIYGSVAAMGLTFVSEALIAQQSLFRLVGGAFLCALGVKTFLAEPAAGSSRAETASILRGFVSTLLLTLTNPMTILSFAAIFSGLGAADTPGEYASAGRLVCGVFLGSALWWLMLSSTVSLLRDKLNQGALRWVNRIAGAVIGGYGVCALLRVG